MRRGLAIAGMCALPLLGCGEEAPIVNRDATVSGFDYISQQAFTTQVWVMYTDQEQIPSGAQFISDHDVDVCVLRDNPVIGYDEETYTPLYLDMPNDWQCDLGQCGWFNEDESNRCEHDTAKRFTYQQLETHTAVVCRPQERETPSENKPSHPRVDQPCIDNALQNGFQPETPVESHIVYVSYDATREDGTSYHVSDASAAIDGLKWQRLRITQPVTVYERGGLVLDVDPLATTATTN